MNLDDILPTVNWPETSGHYKVVQLLIDGKPHLRLEPVDAVNHAQMIMHIANELGREVLFQERNGDYLPKLESDRYKVQGMGLARVDSAAKKVDFTGVSFDYEIGISEENLAAIRPLVPDWTLRKL
jgi:hypothetical protein